MTLFCQACGDEVASSYRFCPSCGSQNFTSNRALVGAAAAPAPAAPVSKPSPAAPAVAPPTANPGSRVSAAPPQFALTGPYAGFWRRFAAYLVDTMVLIVLYVVAAFIIEVIAPNAEDTSQFAGLSVFTLLITWLYFAQGESSRHMGTLGKRALSLSVVDESGQRLGFGQATGRFFAKFLSSILFCIGYLMIAFTEKKQGLHDKLAGTYVLRGGE